MLKSSRTRRLLVSGKDWQEDMKKGMRAASMSNDMAALIKDKTKLNTEINTFYTKVIEERPAATVTVASAMPASLKESPVIRYPLLAASGDQQTISKTTAVDDNDLKAKHIEAEKHKRFTLLNQCWKNLYELEHTSRPPPSQEKKEILQSMIQTIMSGKSFCQCKNCRNITFPIGGLDKMNSSLGYCYEKSQLKLEEASPGFFPSNGKVHLSLKTDENNLWVGIVAV
ncbi:hypothetical protein O3M35_013187 [Rhynocoris fuscipes]|uniref:Uncharacterized protein n=1 Tax=Rhynocoris fuscipes TaxID=488301 RepID=A0AAW1CEP9_9HEMI